LVLFYEIYHDARSRERQIGIKSISKPITLMKYKKSRICKIILKYFFN